MLRATSPAAFSSWFSREVSHPNADQAWPRRVYEIWQGKSRGWNSCSELMRLFQLLLGSRWVAMLQPSPLPELTYNRGVRRFRNVSVGCVLKLVCYSGNSLTRAGNKRVTSQRNVHCEFNADKVQLYLIIFTITAKTGVTLMEALTLSSRSRIDRIEPPVKAQAPIYY